jgi:hypothetical protein
VPVQGAAAMLRSSCMARVQLRRAGLHNVGHIMVMIMRARFQQDPVSERKYAWTWQRII